MKGKTTKNNRARRRLAFFTACFMLLAMLAPGMSVAASAAEAVAEVYDADGNFYRSYTNSNFALAVNAAAKNSGKVRLVNGVDLKNSYVAVKSAQDVVIDLNGFQIATAGQYVFVVEGALTLEDSSVGKTGTVSSSHEKGQGVRIQKRGSLVINQANISAAYGVYVTSSSTTARPGSVVMNKGKIQAAYGIYASSSNKTSPDAVNGTIVMNGGKIEADNRGIYLLNGFEFTMNGGEIAVPDVGQDAFGIDIRGSKAILNPNPDGGEDPKVTVGSGASGVFLGGLYVGADKKAVIKNHPDSVPSEFIMNGGSVHSVDRFALSTNNQYSAGCKAAISGGSVTADDMAAIYWPSEGALDIRGGAEITGYTAVDIRMGTLNISENARLTGTGDYGDYFFSREFPGACPDGSALRVTAEIYGDTSKAGNQYIQSGALTVNVAGGRFSSAKNNAIHIYTCGYTDQRAEVHIYTDNMELASAANKQDVGYVYERTLQHGDDSIVQSDIENGIRLAVPERTTSVNIYGNGINSEDISSIDSKGNVETSANEWKAVKTVTYELTGEIPEGITPPEPVQVANNTLYQAVEGYNSVEIKDTYGNVTGRYTFEGWDYNDTEPVRRDRTIIGRWSFDEVLASAHDVIYSWAGLPAGTTFYDEDGNVAIPALPDPLTGLVRNQPYTLVLPDVTTVYTHDANGRSNGVYTLTPWVNAAGQVMGDEDIVVVGTWRFAPIEPGVEPPADPVAPEVPGEPETPVAPPVAPEVPGEPEAPVTPPVVPEAPGEPETPVTPPVAPEAPGEPEAPVAPSAEQTVPGAAAAPLVPQAPEVVSEAPNAPVEAPVVIPENVPPLAGIDDGQNAPSENESSVETIEDEQTPLARADGSWALMNLIFAAMTVALGAITALGKERKALLKALGLFVSAISVLIFLLTENMSLTMTMVDGWTIPMAIIVVMNAAVLVVSRKLKDDEKDQRA